MGILCLHVTTVRNLKWCGSSLASSVQRMAQVVWRQPLYILSVNILYKYLKYTKCTYFEVSVNYSARLIIYKSTNVRSVGATCAPLRVSHHEILIT